MLNEIVQTKDIDIDICPSKREEIFSKIREERGELGCVQVCTFGTLSTKATIKAACRGYRAPDYPDGVPLDEAKYLTTLIPSERDVLWSLTDVINGNREKNRQHVAQFCKTINKYPGLKEIMLGLEGLVVQRGIHASGVNFYGDDPYETACFMKAKSGAIITQYSLHDAEKCGDVKYDFLVTEIQDVLTQCTQLLQKDEYMNPELSLREDYNTYLHPDKLPLDDPKLWEALNRGGILKLFQFSTSIGASTLKEIQPHTPEEMSDCNCLMRLMAPEGEERPADRYKRLKGNIQEWYKEMDKRGLTKAEQKIFEKHCLDSYGTPSTQESLMLALMDKDLCGFTVAEANAARKIVARFSWRSI